MKKEDSEHLIQACICLFKAWDKVNQMPLTNKVKKTRTDLYLVAESLLKEVRTRTLKEELSKIKNKEEQ